MMPILALLDLVKLVQSLAALGIGLLFYFGGGLPPEEFTFSGHYYGFLPGIVLQLDDLTPGHPFRLESFYEVLVEGRVRY